MPADGREGARKDHRRTRERRVRTGVIERGAIGRRAQTISSMRRAFAKRAALMVALVAQLADAVTFVVAIRVGVPLEAEANPLAREAYGAVGLGGLIALKLAGVALAIALLAVAELSWSTGSRGLRLVLLGCALVGAVGFFGAFTNVRAAFGIA